MYNYQKQQGSKYNSQVGGGNLFIDSARQSMVSGNQTRGRPEDAYSNYQGKMKALGRVKYINQLARLQYEDKLTELHSKYTAQSKKSVQNKLKAKNQIAEFIDEEEQLDAEFEELMDYKYGASKWKNFHFQQQSKKAQYIFCPLCDQIHSTTPQQHDQQCQYRELSRSPLYYFESIDRIITSLGRMNSRQALDLRILAEKIKNSDPIQRQLKQIAKIVKDDPVLFKITEKLREVIQATYN